MKLSTYKWNICYVDDEREKPISYYGWKTKKDVQAYCDMWNSTNKSQIKVIKY